MVQALLTLSENTSRALDVVKAKYRLKDKSAAVEFLANRYIDDSGDPELRPEFIEELIRIQREPFIRVDDFEGRYLGSGRIGAARQGVRKAHKARQKDV